MAEGNVIQTGSQSFKKYKIVRNKKKLEFIFQKGISIVIPPFKVIMAQEPFSGKKQPVLQYVFSVPKKNIKMATDRNRIKRQMREVCRIQDTHWRKYFLQHKQNAYIAIVYVGKEKISFRSTQKKLNLAVIRLTEKIKN